jgi:hypothetical protein
MILFVKTFTGQNWQLEITEESKGFDVKKQIEEFSGVPIAEQVLIFAGRRVDDDSQIVQINPQYELMFMRRIKLDNKLTKEIPCFICKKPTNNGCLICDVPYCGRECQMNDWKDHKFSCKLRE